MGCVDFGAEAYAYSPSSFIDPGLVLGFPALALAVAPAIKSIPTAQAPATEAQIAALQQAVQNAQSSGDNAWVLVSAALVLLMTGPGLTLFYGGLVRRKNILGTMMQSFAMMGLITVLWALRATRWPSATATPSSAALTISSCAAFPSRPIQITPLPFPNRPSWSTSSCSPSLRRR